MLEIHRTCKIYMTSYCKAFESYRLTDRQISSKLAYIPRRVGGAWSTKPILFFETNSIPRCSAHANEIKVCLQGICICVRSDLLCGTLFCDISTVTDLTPDNYGWSQHGNWTFTDNHGVPQLCRFAYYRTFYDGPDRTDPGYVPNGASCGHGKVFDEIYSI